MENIDDEADLYGIDFVKSDDAGTAKRYHIYNTPALVYFRKQNPVTFESDLTDEEAILEIRVACLSTGLKYGRTHEDAISEVRVACIP